MYTLLETVTRYLILNRHLIDRNRLPRELVVHLDHSITFHDVHRGGVGMHQWTQLNYYAVKTEYCHRHINREYAHRPMWRVHHDIARSQSDDPYPDWIDLPIADVPVTIDGTGPFAIRTFKQHPEAVNIGFYLDWLGFGIPIHFGGYGYPGRLVHFDAVLPSKPVLMRSMP